MNNNFHEGVISRQSLDRDHLLESLDAHSDRYVAAISQVTTFFNLDQQVVMMMSNNIGTMHRDAANRAREEAFLANKELQDQDSAHCTLLRQLVEESVEQSEYPDSCALMLYWMETRPSDLRLSNFRYAIENEILRGSAFSARLLLRILLYALATNNDIIRYDPLNMRDRGNMLVIFHLMTRYDPNIEQVRLTYEWSGMFFERRGSYIDIDMIFAELVRAGGNPQTAERINAEIVQIYYTERSRETANDIIHHRHPSRVTGTSFGTSTESFSSRNEQSMSIASPSVTTKVSKARNTRHFNQRKKERNIPDSQVRNVLKTGTKVTSGNSSSNSGSSRTAQMSTSSAPFSSGKQSSSSVHMKKTDQHTVVYSKDRDGTPSIITAYDSSGRDAVNENRASLMAQVEAIIYDHSGITGGDENSLFQRLIAIEYTPEMLEQFFGILVAVSPTFEFMATVIRAMNRRNIVISEWAIDRMKLKK